MRVFKNEIGCEMSFEEGIDEKVIKERLSWLGDN